MAIVKELFVSNDKWGCCQSGSRVIRLGGLEIGEMDQGEQEMGEPNYPRL